MSDYVIGQSVYRDGNLKEVTIQCLDAPEPPDYHLYEPHEVEPSDVVRLLKWGQKVFVWWDEPIGKIPVEAVTLADGTVSIEVAQQGQPVGFRSLADLAEVEAAKPIITS